MKLFWSLDGKKDPGGQLTLNVNDLGQNNIREGNKLGGAHRIKSGTINEIREVMLFSQL